MQSFAPFFRLKFLQIGEGGIKNLSGAGIDPTGAFQFRGDAKLDQYFG